MKMMKRYLIDVQFSTDRKTATTQDRQTLQNSDEKQYCRYWILHLVVFTRFSANKDCLLKLYMLVRSARTVSRALYWEKTCLHWVYFMWLAEGVATIFCCCAKVVFMLFTIGLWHSGLKLYILYCLENDNFKTA